MVEDDERWRHAVVVARSYLTRFRDARTRALRDEIAQESAVLAWRWAAQLSDPTRFDAAVRTITRRQRLRSLRGSVRACGARFVPLGEEDAAEPAAKTPEPSILRIGARRVPRGWAVGRLERVLGRLSGLDQQLLRGFHEGFCCAELASRFGRSEACVKTRLHRARRRVQQLYEELVRDAGVLDEGRSEER